MGFGRLNWPISSKDIKFMTQLMHLTGMQVFMITLNKYCPFRKSNIVKSNLMFAHSRKIYRYSYQTNNIRPIILNYKSYIITDRRASWRWLLLFASSPTKSLYLLQISSRLRISSSTVAIWFKSISLHSPSMPVYTDCFFL